MFTYLLSFLQVMPKFVDLALAFGSQITPKEFHYTAFSEESFLDTGDARLHAIPELGRSGKELRLCYNLWSVEESKRPGPWSIRQTAVYHSFDLDTTRALWINIKGNEAMADRITQAIGTSSQLQPSSIKTKSGAFAASLLTHILIFEWSAENWRELISHLEKKLREVLRTAKSASMDKVETALDVDLNALIQQLSNPEPTPKRVFSRVNSENRNGPPRANTVTSNWSIAERIRTGFSRRSTGVDTYAQNSGPLSSPASPISPILSSTVFTQAQRNGPVGELGQLSLLRDFKVRGLQELTNIGEKLHEASLVMKLNMDILDEVVAYYEFLVSTNKIPCDIQRDSGEAFQTFVRRVRGIARDQQMERSRIETLIKMFEDGKDLVSVTHSSLKKSEHTGLLVVFFTQFDSILQFRNMEINKLFVANAHQSGRKMQIMTEEMHRSTLKMEEMTESTKTLAEKTEKQTTSMHIVTLVTLVFLPGTFVAVRYGLPTLSKSTEFLTKIQTFFSSGSFQWDQNNADSTAMPYWKPEFFALFVKVCFPMTGIIFLIWLGLFYGARYRRRQRAAIRDEEQQWLPGKMGPEAAYKEL